MGVSAGYRLALLACFRSEQIPADPSIWTRNITLTGGMTPARAYIDELLPEVLNGKVEPGHPVIRLAAT
jgi:threonine dehydrogenase-like Zn-dependent dehydrogenase